MVALFAENTDISQEACSPTGHVAKTERFLICAPFPVSLIALSRSMTLRLKLTLNLEQKTDTHETPRHLLYPPKAPEHRNPITRIIRPSKPRLPNPPMKYFFAGHPKALTSTRGFPHAGQNIPLTHRCKWAAKSCMSASIWSVAYSCAFGTPPAILTILLPCGWCALGNGLDSAYQLRDGSHVDWVNSQQLAA